MLEQSVFSNSCSWANKHRLHLQTGEVVRSVTGSYGSSASGQEPNSSTQMRKLESKAPIPPPPHLSLTSVCSHLAPGSWVIKWKVHKLFMEDSASTGEKSQAWGLLPFSGYLLTDSPCSSPVTLGKMRLPEASPQLSKENCHLYHIRMWHPTPAGGSAPFLPHSKSLKYYSMM